MLVIVADLVVSADESVIDLDHWRMTIFAAHRGIAIDIAHVLPDLFAHAPRGFVVTPLALDFFAATPFRDAQNRNIT